MLKGVYASLFLFTVIGCGGSSTPASPTQSAQSFDGTWTGGSGAAPPSLGAIRFVVQGGVVTSFSITVTVPPGQANPCTNTHTVNPNAPIADSAFTFSADVRSSSLPIGAELFVGPVTGTFTSRASGSVTIGRAGSVTGGFGGGEYAYIYGALCGFAVTQGLPSSPATVAVNRSGP